MLAAIGSAWKTHLKTAYPPTDRLYMDFRKQDYPDLGTGSAAYTLAREDNLIDRGNCESATAPALLGLTPSAVSNCTFARSSDFARSGDYSFKFTKTVAAGTPAYAFLTPNATTNMSGFKAGEVVEAEAYVYIPTASGIQASEIYLLLSEYDASGAAWTDIISAQPTALDSWVRVAGSCTIPSDDVTGIRIAFLAASASADTEYFYVDDIIIKRHSVSGSHYLSGGYVESLCEMPETFTLRIKFRPTFAYNTGSNTPLCGWYAGADQNLYITYVAASDTFAVSWKDGVAGRLLSSAKYDNGTSYRNINQSIELVAAIDLTTGDTTGSRLWMNGTQDDTAWSGNIDAKSTVFNKLQIRAQNGTAGAYDIAYCELIPNYVATASDVANDFADVTAERIYWDLNGHGTGRTRCDVTRFVRSQNGSVTNGTPLSGEPSANSIEVELNSIDGEFADDQYAAFDTTVDQFNGLVTQAYLKGRPRVWLETWYGGDFEQVFFGRVDAGGLSRSTLTDGYSIASFVAEDIIEQLATTRVRNAQAWEAYDIASATETESLMHLIARLGTKRYVRNYAGSSSVEDSDITLSYNASGGTLTREADPLLGTYCGQIANSSGDTQTVHQFVTFTAPLHVSVGDTFTLAIYLKSAGAMSIAGGLKLEEHDAGGSNDSTTEDIELAGGEGWVLHFVTHTVTDSDSDRFKLIWTAEDGDTLKFDCLWFGRGTEVPRYFVNNTSHGSSGACLAIDYAEGSYDTCGFDIPAIGIEHPWRRVEERASVHDELKQLTAAVGCRYYGADEAGNIKVDSILSDTYADPIISETIDDEDFSPGIVTEAEARGANAIIGYGSIITIQSMAKLVWDIKSTDEFDRDDAGMIYEIVANGETWPSYEYWAQYGDSTVTGMSGGTKNRPVETGLNAVFRGYA